MVTKEQLFNQDATRVRQGPRRSMAHDKRYSVNVVKDDEAMLVTLQILQVCSGRILHQLDTRRLPTKDPVPILGMCPLAGLWSTM